MPLPSRLYAARLSLAVMFLVGSLSWMSGDAKAAVQLRGAQVHSLWSSVSSAEMTRELDALKDANADVLRVDVGWRTLEWSKGRYDAAYLAKLDALAAGAQARGIRLIVTLWQTPPWASDAGSWQAAPRDPQDYGNVARYLAARYQNHLAAIEVWNEPDIHDNLIAAALPATYAAMVKAAHTSVATVAPTVPVLASFVKPAFLQSLYASGINGYHGGVSIHPYADGADPADLTVDHSFLGAIQKLRAAQTAAGDDTPVYVTEFGWPVGTSRGANTEREQAEYTERAFGLVGALPYVAAASIYQLRDMGDDASNAEDNFGLLKRDFTPRPAYAGFAAALARPSAAVAPTATRAAMTAATTTTTTTTTTVKPTAPAPVQSTKATAPTTTEGRLAEHQDQEEQPSIVPEAALAAQDAHRLRRDHRPQARRSPARLPACEGPGEVPAPGQRPGDPYRRLPPRARHPAGLHGLPGRREARHLLGPRAACPGRQAVLAVSAGG